MIVHFFPLSVGLTPRVKPRGVACEFTGLYGMVWYGLMIGTMPKRDHCTHHCEHILLWDHKTAVPLSLSVNVIIYEKNN